MPSLIALLLLSLASGAAYAEPSPFKEDDVPDAKGRAAAAAPQGENCFPDVYLDSPMDRSMARVEPRDQYDLGICYAESAAQMVDAWRFTHGIKNYKHQTSSVWTALNTKAAQGADAPDGGYICDAAQNILGPAPKGGSCRQDAVNADYGGRTYKEFLAEIGHYHEEYAAGLDLPSGTNREMQLGATAARLAAKLEKLGFGSTAPPIDTLHNLLALPNLLDYERGVLAFKCRDDAIFWPPPYACESTNSLTMAAPLWLVLIHARLSLADPQPVGVSFCGTLLQRWSGYVGVDRANGRLYQDCGAHAGLIIGRRKNKKTGACQLLLRNSWGKKCADWAAKDLECDHGANVWFDQKDLAYNVFGLSWLK